MLLKSNELPVQVKSPHTPQETLVTVCQGFLQERTRDKRTSLTTPFQTGPSDLCLWGLNLWTEALYSYTHAHTDSLTHTSSVSARSISTSFSAVSIKPHWQEPCPLLSNRHAEMFTFTYKWPGVMLCHIMFHGQIMCSISQSALQPLSPLLASIVTATPRHHGCKKGSLWRHSEVPLWIKSWGYRGELYQQRGPECLKEIKGKYISTRGKIWSQGLVLVSLDLSVRWSWTKWRIMSDQGSTDLVGKYAS